MTDKKDKQISDEMLEELKRQGVKVISLPNLRGSVDMDNMDDIDDITLFSELVPLMTEVAVALGRPAPSHKEIKEALQRIRKLSKLQSSKEE